ncbi:MAG: ATP synthase F1 subunit gamma [Clostridia bacterium]|nr:ATP synthase F1 subunit gamma [Clostridia bacterium]
MRNFSDIRHRIKSVSDTRKITGAMETISVAKMRKALARYENNKAYFETIRHAINDIVLYSHHVEHKVFSPSEDKRLAFIVIASDKGLAGGFNHTVLNYACEKMKDYENPHLFAVGQVAASFFVSRNTAIDDTFADASFDPSAEQAAQMSDRLYKMFLSGEIDGAYIVYTAMRSSAGMAPVADRLLPFNRESVLQESECTTERKKELHEIEYEPSPEEVLASLIPQYLTGMIYGALIQSSACEHSQRRAAMSSATKNAAEILDGLQLEYNRARQESVTGEITEIVTAANGVKQ